MLTAAQVALAVVLIVCAACCCGAFSQSERAAGFETRIARRATLELPEAIYDRTREVGFYAQYLDRIRAIPGVVSAGGVSPAAASRRRRYDRKCTSTVRAPKAAPGSRLPPVTPDYFRTMGIP